MPRTALAESRAARDLAHLLIAVHGHDLGEIRALGGGTGPGGGYLVPEQTLQELWTPRAPAELPLNVIRVGTDVVRIPLLESLPSPAIVGENTPGTEASESFGSLTLTNRRMEWYEQASEDLFSDAGGLAEVLAPAITRGFSAARARLALNGAGTTEPEGVLVNAGVGEEAVTNTDDASVLASIEAGLAKIPAAHRQAAETRAAMHPKAYAKLRERGLIGFEVVRGHRRPFLGDVEVVLNDDIAVTAGAPDTTTIAVGDWAMYVLVERGPLVVRTDNQGRDEWSVLIRWLQRIDARLAIPAAFVRLTGLEV